MEPTQPGTCATMVDAAHSAGINPEIDGISAMMWLIRHAPRAVATTVAHLIKLANANGQAGTPAVDAPATPPPWLAHHDAWDGPSS